MHHFFSNLSFISLKPFTRQSLPHMKTAFSLFALVFVCAMGHTVSAADKDLDSRALLSKLDDIVENREYYYNLRKAKADSVKSLIDMSADDSDKLPLYYECGRLWSGLSADTAVSVLELGLDLSRELGDSCYAQKFIIELSLTYFKRGQLLYCLSGLKHIEDNGIRPGLEQRFHYVSLVVCYTMGALYMEEDNKLNYYIKRGKESVEKELSYLSPEVATYHFCDALGKFADRRYADMIISLCKVIDNPSADESMKEVSHTLLGECHMLGGNNEEAIRNYAMGAMYDTKLANLDEVALLRLGELLYRLGDTTRAYNYLTVSLENAVKADMKFNLTRLNEAFMDVSNAQNREKHQRVSLLVGLVVVFVVLLLVVSKMIANKRREVKHLRRVESRLARANLAKDTYIAEFMNLCSSYIESLEDYNRMSKRKITAGQTEELLAYIKSGRIIEEQHHKFYDVFDDALLHIFPDYIADVNKLLQPDKQIVTPSPKVLTTELRVLALSRLGIEDASIIARFLGISTNTIYTYRNKLRTRAINRTTFEEDARKIGAV